jgi:hypothetical protein
MASKDETMTEADWLETREPDDLLLFLSDRSSERKLRLFGCACVRRVFGALGEECMRQSVRTCERFIEGLATDTELESARQIASAVYRGIGDIIEDHSPMAVDALCSPKGSLGIFTLTESVAAIAAEASEDPQVKWGVAHEHEREAQCHLFRDIFGNPFRPVEFDSRLSAWSDGTISKLAQAIYDERAFERLPILADALEDAGCDNADILAHCRGPGPHVRGCWVVDLILGKE